MTHKTCSKCHDTKSVTNFYRTKWNTTGYRSECRKCTLLTTMAAPNRKQVSRIAQRRYERKQSAEWHQQAALGMRERRAQFRAIVIELYGGKCFCCGETIEKFLTIDHVNVEQGKADRKTFKATHMLHAWLAERPKQDGYRLACWNCNCGRARNGGVCPHEEERSRVAV